MKHKEMLDLIDNIFDHVTNMHTNGQKEYAMNEDSVFANLRAIVDYPTPPLPLAIAMIC